MLEFNINNGLFYTSVLGVMILIWVIRKYLKNCDSDYEINEWED